MIKTVLFLTGDDWVAIYVENNAVFQAHHITPMEFLMLSEEHGFKYIDILKVEAGQRDIEKCEAEGNFPQHRNELLYVYG